MTNGLAGDRPIQLPTEDVFGVSSFAKALATSLLQMSPKDGLVISVEAPWGAGKSSAIALAIREIQVRVLKGLGEGLDELEVLTSDELDARWAKKAKKRRVHIVRFNPWLFSGQENLVRAFFKELEAQVDVKADGKIKKTINKLAEFLPSVGGGLAAGGAFAAGHVPVAAAAGAAGRAAGEAAGKLLASDTSLERAKWKLAKELREIDQRIIVIIDDLDRLMPCEMRAVLSMVKSLGDLPTVLYVLAFDRKIVTKALATGLEKLDPDFLEKIVQVSLKLPPPWREELRSLFFSKINAVIGNAEPADRDRWRQLFIGAIDLYLETPRDVTRLANTLQVVWPNVAGDVDFSDMVTLTALQLFDPSVYDLIHQEIETITHADHKYEDDKAFGERLEPKNARNPEAAKEAMTLLFPRIAKAWSKHTFDREDYITQCERRRLCTKEYHRNYFLLGRDSRRLPKSEIERLLGSEQPLEILRDRLASLVLGPEVQGVSAVATFLDQIVETVFKHPRLSPAFVRALLDCSDDLIRREDATWELFVQTNRDRLDTIIRYGVELLSAAQREEILEVLKTHPAGLQLRSGIIADDARRHGLFDGKVTHESELLFPRGPIEAAALEVREQIRQACENGTVWGLPAPMRLVWRWRRLATRGDLEPWFQQTLNNDEWVIKLGAELPQKAWRSGGDGQSVFWSFEREYYTDCFDVDALITRLSELARTSTQAANVLERLNAAERANGR
ncbi:MAG TPA: P-loop NTPase fold protein [Methylocella sp.]